MSANGSKIQWTGHTWNPTTGCSRVSPGCDGCYAIPVSHRLGRNPNPKISRRHEGLTMVTEAGLDWTGDVRLNPDPLELPLQWRDPRTIFVNSLSDLFHAGFTDEDIAQVFAVMALTPQHTYQVLTKRPQRMADWFAYDFLGENQQMQVQEAVTSLTRRLGWKRPVIFDGRLVNPDACTTRGRLADDRNYDRRAPLAWPLPNVWLGTSIENDRYAFRADHLRRTPAAIRFISAEPLLGPLPSLDLTSIDWLIVGGESKQPGHPARHMDPAWALELRYRCELSAGECDLCGITDTHRVTLTYPAGSDPITVTRCVACGSDRGDRTAFFFKQAGHSLAREWGCSDPKGGDIDEVPEDLRIREMPGG